MFSRPLFCLLLYFPPIRLWPMSTSLVKVIKWLSLRTVNSMARRQQGTVGNETAERNRTAGGSVDCSIRGASCSGCSVAVTCDCYCNVVVVVVVVASSSSSSSSTTLLLLLRLIPTSSSSSSSFSSCSFSSPSSSSSSPSSSS